MSSHEHDSGYEIYKKVLRLNEVIKVEPLAGIIVIP